MKFRSKTGKILNDYVAFRGDFCCEYRCEDCPIGKRCTNGLCEKWVHEHPCEAARLMGYEVVEDDHFREVTKMIERADNLDEAIEKYLKIKEGGQHGQAVEGLDAGRGKGVLRKPKWELC